MFYYQNKPVGIAFVILGLVAVIGALYPVLVYAALLVIGLYLINLGLRLWGKPPIILVVREVIFRHLSRM